MADTSGDATASGLQAPADTGSARDAGAGGAAQDAARTEAGTAVGFAKRSKNRGTLRKRAAEGEEEDDGGPAGEGGGGGAAVRKLSRPGRKDAPLGFTTKRADKTELFTFQGSNALQQRNDDGATRALETETAHDRDARALREQVLQQAAAAGAAGGAAPGGAPPPLDDGVYRGMNAYTDFRAGFRQEHTIGAEKGSGSHGPLRGSTNVRMTVRVDYQPDLCKDYKETGYCGFGDSCKFLHDRGDYKAGYELDREWEEKQKAQRERLLAGTGEDASGEESEEDDGLPFACLICREPWGPRSDPVVTRCKHYFCEQCALKHNAKTGKCFMCEQATGGIFNVAKEIERKMKKEAAAG